MCICIDCRGTAPLHPQQQPDTVIPIEAGYTFIRVNDPYWTLKCLICQTPMVYVPGEIKQVSPYSMTITGGKFQCPKCNPH